MPSSRVLKLTKIHPTRLPQETLLESCAVKRTRGSGPGGQHRNKVETAIVITHTPTGVVGQASEKRSQKQNRDVAVERLRLNLALAVRSELASEPQPSECWLSRIKAKKIIVSPSHFDYPALIAEALDFVAFHSFDVSTAANAMGVSTSQLVKFFKTCPPAFEMVNRERAKLDLHRLG
ncbi:MAG: peptide chain release factor-like protein [Mariniblastus sp.]